MKKIVPQVSFSKSVLFFATTIFLLLLTVFGLSAYFLKIQIQRNAETRHRHLIATETIGIKILAEKTLDEYFNLLHGARALYAASQSVERDEWKQYVTSLNVSENNSSIISFGYLPSTEVLEYPSNFNGGALKTPTEILQEEEKNTEMFVVNLDNSFETSISTFWLEFHSRSAMKDAMLLARDTNDIIMTEPIIVTQDSGTEVTAFLAMLPVYEQGKNVDTLEERAQAITGYTVLVVNVGEFFSQIISQNNLQETSGFSVSDITFGEDEIVGFMDEIGFLRAMPKALSTPIQKLSIIVGTRHWELRFFSDVETLTEPLEDFFVIFLFGSGAIISFLVGGVLLNSSRLRSRAEGIARELTKDLEKFRLAVASASDQIVITDVEGTVIYANEVVRKITGYSPEEVMGTKAGKMWGGKMPAEFYKNMWHQIKEEKKVFESEVNNIRKSGEDYVASVKISPVLDAKGNVEFFVAIERDITREKEVDRMKTEFISLASHQLRTPLTAIRWFTEMFRDGDMGELDADQVEVIDKIWLSTRKMIDLVNGLLNISRLESGRIIIEPVATPIKKLLSSVVQDIAPVLKKKNQTVVIEVGDVPEISLDPKLISNVVMNLISNASKYSAQDAEIRVQAGSDGDQLKVAVTDSGIGIPEQVRSRVFIKFFRAENAIHTEAEGTGLGLYLAKAIVEASGGRIGFESIEGKGTTFWFTIPLEGMQPKKGEVSLQENRYD